MAFFNKQRLFSLLERHGKALLYVLKELFPEILRTGRKPVIFSRWSGMGDIICTIPAALELKKRHPSVTFLYNCDPDFALIPSMSGIADRITHCREIGIVGHWYRFLLGGFYNFAHGDDSPDSVDKKPMYQEFGEQFGLPLLDSHPTLEVREQARKNIIQRLAANEIGENNLILLHCGPSWPVREWPAEAWLRLVEGLRSHGYTNLVQVGLGGYMASQQTQPVHGRQVDLGEATVHFIPGTISLIGALSLEELIAVISMARLFIGIDSGLLHIAACFRISAVGIFGPTLPRLRFAESFCGHFVVSQIECAGCQHRKPLLHWITGCPYDIKCMHTLPVQDVLESCLRQLTKDVECKANANGT